ncbi:MAG: hypothetical protein Greene041614_434, partial [Parcubacteria group bacterium Greene0416_14]
MCHTYSRDKAQFLREIGQFQKVL